MKNLDALYHRPNTASTQDFLNPSSIHGDCDFLKVRVKSPVCSPQGEASIMTKSRLFTADFALSHFQFLSTIALFISNREFEFYHDSYRFSTNDVKYH